MNRKTIFLFSILTSLALVGCNSTDKSDTGEKTAPTGETTTPVTTSTEKEHVHSLKHYERVEPTCKKAGNVEYYQCEICGLYFSDSEGKNEIQDIVLAKTPHTFEFKEKIDPTCIDAGYDIYECSVCGTPETRNYVDALGHKLDGETRHSDPSCLEAGRDETKCSRCGEFIETKIYSALGHQDNGSPKVHEPTCTEEGYTEHTCSRCNEKYFTDYKDALGHDYDEDNIKHLDATCEHVGYDAVECKRCHEYRYSYTSQHNHNFVDGVCTECEKEVTKTVLFKAKVDKGEPVNVEFQGDRYIVNFPSGKDASENGKTHCIFNVDRSTINALIEVGIGSISFSLGSYDGKLPKAFGMSNGDNWEYINVGGTQYSSDLGKWFTRKICDEDGNPSSLVTNNGMDLIVVHGNMVGYPGLMPDFAVKIRLDCLHHTPKTTIKHDPTCTEKGYDEHECAICGVIYKDNYIDALGHDYKEIATYDEATCEHIKGTVSECSRCGDIHEDIIEPKLSHEFVDGTCVNCHKTLDEIDLVSATTTKHAPITVVKNENIYTVKAKLSNSERTYIHVDGVVLEELVAQGYNLLSIVPKKSNNNGRIFYVDQPVDCKMDKGVNIGAGGSQYAGRLSGKFLTLQDDNGELKAEYKNGYTFSLVAAANGNSDTSDFDLDVRYFKKNSVGAFTTMFNYERIDEKTASGEITIGSYSMFGIDARELEGHESVTVAVTLVEKPFGGCQPVSPFDNAVVAPAANATIKWTVKVADYVDQGVFFFSAYINPNTIKVFYEF